MLAAHIFLSNEQLSNLKFMKLLIVMPWGTRNRLTVSFTVKTRPGYLQGVQTHMKPHSMGLRRS